MRNVSSGQFDPLRHALQLPAMTLRLVPLAGKLIKDWPQIHLTEENILTWTQRGVNWGIITGEPLVVLDTDTPEAERALHDKGMASTTVVRTGRGGFHHYFRSLCDADIRSRAGLRNIDGLDLKAWHSYVVAAGSVHAQTGERYTYVRGKEFRSLDSLPVFQARWAETPRHQVPFGAPWPQAEKRGRINDIFAYLLCVESVQGRYGSNGCFRACCLLRDEGYSPLEAWPILLWWNERKPVPPWSERELIHKLESVYRVPLRGVLGN
jgi:hypothetical protein